MSNAADRLMRWIIDASAGEPADHRVQILRDAAKIIAGGDASICGLCGVATGLFDR